MSQNRFTLKRFLPACIAVSLLAASSLAVAKEQVYGAISLDKLSNGYGPWSMGMVGYAFNNDGRNAAIQLEQHRRFNKEDSALDVSGGMDIGSGFALTAGAYVSSGQFLARHGLALGVAKKWGTTVAESNIRYRQAADGFDQFMASLGGTTYLPGWTVGYRASADVSNGKLSGLLSYAASLTREFTDYHSVTVAAGFGRERNMDMGFELEPQRVRAYSVSARFPVAKDVYLRPAIAWTQQGSIYDRTTAVLGVEFVF